MNTLTFDTVKFTRKLEASGFTSQQAESIVEVWSEVTSTSDIATKADLIALKADLVAVKKDLQKEIQESEMRMVKWFIPLLLGQTALIIALVKIII